MSKHTVIFKNETLTLTEILLSDGSVSFWMYDHVQGMNLAMNAPTEQAAFVECILYYQERLKDTKGCYNSLREKVNAFTDSLGLVESDNNME